MFRTETNSDTPILVGAKRQIGNFVICHFQNLKIEEARESGARGFVRAGSYYGMAEKLRFSFESLVGEKILKTKESKFKVGSSLLIDVKVLDAIIEVLAFHLAHALDLGGELIAGLALGMLAQH